MPQKKKLFYKTRKLAVLFVLILLIANVSLAQPSVCVKSPRSAVNGEGPLPYNYRVIDGHIHAGGHPLNPTNDFKNSDKATLAILAYLRSKNVKLIVDLEDTKSIYQRYRSLLDKSELKLLHFPMGAVKMPTEDEWKKIKEAMNDPVYIHCKWGADRTGMVIAKYLMEEKGYAKDAALRAVSTGGSHAGIIGGLKRIFLANIFFLNFLER